MKREEVLKIINDSELDEKGKLDKIMDLHGAGIESIKKTVDDARALYEARSDYEDLKSQRDNLLAERDNLLAEKNDRVFTDRFTAAVGENKFKNSFTFEGVKQLFKEASDKPENKDKPDSEIFKIITDGKENEYFENPVKISMTPAAGKINLPTNEKAFLDEKFKDSPWYKG